jgi:septal ring factor EnvC (AmiA/AmiB activator)
MMDADELVGKLISVIGMKEPQHMPSPEYLEGGYKALLKVVSVQHRKLLQQEKELTELKKEQKTWKSRYHLLNTEIGEVEKSLARCIRERTELKKRVGVS